MFFSLSHKAKKVSVITKMNKTFLFSYTLMPVRLMLIDSGNRGNLAEFSGEL